MSIEPTYVELFRRAVDARLAETFVSVPAEVVTYDRATQTATLQPMVKRLVPDADGILQEESFPQIKNVPVIFPRSKTHHAHFPLSPGDSIGIVFTDRSMASWRSTGLQSSPGDARVHALSTPYAIPGLYPLASPMPTAAVTATPFEGAANGPKVFYGDATVEIKSDLGIATPLANAVKVDTFIATLDTLFRTWVPVPNDGGASLKTAFLAAFAAPPLTVGTTKVRGE